MDEHRPLHDIAVLRPPQVAIAYQAAHPLDALVAAGQLCRHRGRLSMDSTHATCPHHLGGSDTRAVQAGAASAAPATSTSAVNAAGSVTARSANTLRSTSTPAVFSPAMKLL